MGRRIGARAARFFFISTFLSIAAWPGACATGAPGDAPAPGDGGGGVTAPDASSDVRDAALVEADASSSTAPDAAASSSSDGATPDDGGSTPDAPGDVGLPGDSAAAVDASCATGEIRCGATCVSPSTDPNNCGGCGNSCASGTCGTTLAADMSVSPPNWTLNGSAAWSSAGPSVAMTAAQTHNVAGSAVYNDAIVVDSFEASFQFRIGAGGGGQYDGMGFMLETNGPTALGGQGGGLGMSGLTGWGVELDIYDNGSCADTNANHVGIDQLTTCGSGQPTSLFESADLTGTVNLFDAGWHTAAVMLAGSTMSVSVDGNAVAQSVMLAGFASGTPFYFGFAGGIGGSSSSLGAQTEVKDVSIVFPTPRCL